MILPTGHKNYNRRDLRNLLEQGNDYVLKVENLNTMFKIGKKLVYAVNDVSFNLRRGSVLGIVGESGCGKSVTAHSIIQLLPKYGHIAGGKITYCPSPGKELVLTNYKRNSRQIRSLCGKDISMIFQDPLSSLDPVYTIGAQIAETLHNHEKISRYDAKIRIINLLEELGIPSPEERFHAYPHEFSGGMKQRVMIAAAMVCNPAILIADEPTTALDVTIQAQILSLMKKLRTSHNTSMIMITHNMGIVAEICDEVAVMYMGRFVEFGTLEQVFNRPKHPYTRALLRSVPVLGMSKDSDLETIQGVTPDAAIRFEGCAFAERCANAHAGCTKEQPFSAEVEPGNFVRCFLYADSKRKGA